MSGYVIFGDSISGNCHKVKWTADLLRLSYEWRETSVLKGGARAKAFDHLPVGLRRPAALARRHAVALRRVPADRAVDDAAVGFGRAAHERDVFLAQGALGELVGGAGLEADRAKLDVERGRLNRELEKARDPDKPDVEKVRELEPLARKKSEEIRALEEQIARRVAVFKEQLAAAFPGRVAEEGSELLGAEWKDKTLTLRLATLATPEPSAVERVQKNLARREELTSAQVAALAGATGIEIAVTYRQAPAAVGVESDGVTITKLKELLAPTAGEATKDVAHAAQDIYTAALQQTAVAGITVAQAYPASQHFSGQVAGSMKLSALIAILLFSLGILTMLALQANAVATISDTKFRADATLLADREALAALYCEASVWPTMMS